MTNTKRRKITLAQFFRWREYSSFLLELPKPFGLSESELREVLDKLNTAFRANQKHCIGDIEVIATLENRADKYTIANRADLVWVVVFLDFYFGQRRFGAAELFFEVWRFMLEIHILLPTQKDDEMLLKKFMQHINYPNFIGMRLGKYAHSLGISDKITSPLNAVESWFDSAFGDEWEFRCSDDDYDDSFRRFAEFIYANVSFEVVERA